MKIFYLAPKINNVGGVARVLSLKTNYLIEKWRNEVHIATQNNGNLNPFYDFNSKITLHDMSLNGNLISFFGSYRKQIRQQVATINPDVVVVCDNGLKAFLIPFIIKDRPIVLEVHSSLFIEEKVLKNNFFSKFIMRLKYIFKYFAAQKFTKIVVLSEESLVEWHVANAEIIPNPSWINSDEIAVLKNKKVIALARDSYEKGLDRLLLIWKVIHQKFPNWQLDLYTDEVSNLIKKTTELELTSSVNCYAFVKNIQNKYLESSIVAMTSRTEGFPMVLIEAMSLGLPCIAFDCPVGPRVLIKDQENGFLITENDCTEFVFKLSMLMEDESLRLEFGRNAKKQSEKYAIDKVMGQWHVFFERIIKI